MFLKRKAQISQVFTYLMIIMIVGIIVLVGYKGIAWIMKTNCDQGEASFQKELLELIDEYSDRGSTHMQILSAPCNVIKICLADSRLCDTVGEFGDIYAYTDETPEMLVIRSSVADCDSNVFVLGKVTEPIGYAPKLVLKDEDAPFKCFDVRSGKFRFLFRGLGRKTQVEVG